MTFNHAVKETCLAHMYLASVSRLSAAFKLNAAYFLAAGCSTRESGVRLGLSMQSLRCLETKGKVQEVEN